MDARTQKTISEIERHRTELPVVYMIQVSKQRWVIAAGEKGSCLGESYFDMEGAAPLKLQVAGIRRPNVITKPLTYDQANKVAALLQNKRADEIPEEWMHDPSGIRTDIDDIYISLKGTYL